MPDRAVKQAYAAYDSDPRVSGPDDRDAFVDAVTPLMPDRAVVECPDCGSANVGVIVESAECEGPDDFICLDCDMQWLDLDEKDLHEETENA